MIVNKKRLVGDLSDRAASKRQSDKNGKNFFIKILGYKLNSQFVGSIL